VGKRNGFKKYLTRDENKDPEVDHMLRIFRGSFVSEFFVAPADFADPSEY
jgi:hypothetical protein